MKFDIGNNKSRVIFVSGFAEGNPNKDLAVENCWEFTSYIFGYAGRQRSRHIKNLLYVVNESKSLGTVSSKNVRKLQEMLYSMLFEEGSITRAIIAHSHGAYVAYKALQNESLRSFLKQKGVTHVNEMIKQIRGHLAVITLGGIQTIPKSFAQICWNFCFKEDKFAIGGKSAYGEDHAQDIQIRYFGREDVVPQIVVETAAHISKWWSFSSSSASRSGVVASGVLGGSASASCSPVSTSAAVSASGAVLASSASASESTNPGSLMSNKHYMTDYLNCVAVMKAIIEVLKIEDED